MTTTKKDHRPNGEEQHWGLTTDVLLLGLVLVWAVAMGWLVLQALSLIGITAE